jgi:1-phosphatidylinositol-3-phosphate 5-kinase
MFVEDGDGEDERWNLVNLFRLFPHIPRLTIYCGSLLSFGKFLELLVYSHSFHIITPPLCEHTGPTVGNKAEVAPSRPGLNIARHFTYRTHRVTFTLTVVGDIYNVEVPRVQFAYGPRVSEEAKLTPEPPPVSPQSTISTEPGNDDVKRVLKREMRTWWHTLSERIDNLASFSHLCGLPGARLTETRLTQEQIFRDNTEPAVPLKSLPRLPSSDEYLEEEAESSHSSQTTPKVTQSTLPSSPPVTQEPETEAGSAEGTPRMPVKTLPSPPDDELDDETPTSDDAAPATPEKPASPPPSRISTERSDSKLSASTRSLPGIPHGEEMLQLLQNLREDFQREEHSLYSTLTKTPNECLNNARHAFKTSSKGAAKRMMAWEGKHCAKGTKVTSPYPEDPTWWTNGNHAIPGSNILINESDWGSMIAFTLR